MPGRPGTREERTEFPRSSVRQQDGAPAGRDDLKDQVQQLRLQFIQVPDGVNHATDLEQRIQVAGNPRSSRQLPQQAVGVEIKHLLGMDEFCFG